MTKRWPERVRLRGGRLVHAVGYVDGFAERVTACDKFAEEGEFLGDETPVSCRGCQRATGQ